MSTPLHILADRVWTNDPSHPLATSVTIAADRLVALDAAPPAGAMVVDVRGNGLTVIPGFVDAHLHLLMGGLALGELDLSSVRSRQQFEAAIAARHASLPGGDWLIARGWSIDAWPDPAAPHKAWLECAGGRPVVCHRSDGHAVLVNDAVLNRCDLSTPFSGGVVELDAETGQPTGLLVEAAAWEIVNPALPSPSASVRRDALRAAEQHALELGVTAVGSMETREDVERVYLPMREELRLRCRITLLDRDWPLDETLFEFARSVGRGRGLGIIGAKSFLDGTFGGRTARLLAEYSDDPGNRGELIELARSGALVPWAIQVAREGLSPSMHAIGDEAVRLALDVVERLSAAGLDHGVTAPRIEHAQQIDAADIGRFRGVFASMQPLHRSADAAILERRLGAARLTGSFPFRSLADHDAALAFGSDWPVVECDPLATVRAAVTGCTQSGERFGVQQCLTPLEAMRAHTSGAAHALAFDDGGVLRPGGYGDVVMLDRDPLTCDWMTAAPSVVMTVARGVIEHDSR